MKIIGLMVVACAVVVGVLAILYAISQQNDYNAPPPVVLGTIGCVCLSAILGIFFLGTSSSLPLPPSPPHISITSPPLVSVLYQKGRRSCVRPVRLPECELHLCDYFEASCEIKSGISDRNCDLHLPPRHLHPLQISHEYVLPPSLARPHLSDLRQSSPTGMTTMRCLIASNTTSTPPATSMPSLPTPRTSPNPTVPTTTPYLLIFLNELKVPPPPALLLSPPGTGYYDDANILPCDSVLGISFYAVAFVLTPLYIVIFVWFISNIIDTATKQLQTSRWYDAVASIVQKYLLEHSIFQVCFPPPLPAAASC
jgi:hypothetical protein